MTAIIPTITDSGVTIPSLAKILEGLQTSFRSIYGQDIYIEPDSQDGQWLAILAKAINDNNKAMVSTFLSFRPSYAQGVGLSSLVKINGITRNYSTYSTAIGIATGRAGVTVIGCVAQDVNGNYWNIPTFTLLGTGSSGNIVITARDPGNVIIPTGRISIIPPKPYGLDTFTVLNQSTTGTVVETDDALRIRQTKSVSLPAMTLLDSIIAQVSEVTGVTKCVGFENNTGVDDVIPSNSIAIIVEGTPSTYPVDLVAHAIYLKKTPGVRTYGDTGVPFKSTYGQTTVIRYSTVEYVYLYFSITIVKLKGYKNYINASITSKLTEYVNGLEIGDTLHLSQLQAIASLITISEGSTFYIAGFTMGLSFDTLSTQAVSLSYKGKANTQVANIMLVISNG